MKERLTGAIILVVLIVLLVPELLSGPKGPAATEPAGVAPSSSEEPPLRSYTINLGDESHSRAEAPGSNGPAMPQPSAPEQPAAQAGTGRSSTSTPDQPAAAQGNAQAASGGSQGATPGEAAVPPSGTAHAAKAVTPRQKPSTPPSTATARSEPAKPTRTASAGERPTKAHSATSAQRASTGGTSESGWAVQLGVFASRGNAEKLALEVRVKGFKAFVSSVTSGSHKLYRVRVGPTADRTAAQELQAKLKAAGRPAGTVVPYS